MFYLTKNYERRLYFGVPREYVLNNIKNLDEELDDFFFVVYCAIDKWRNIAWRYRGTLLSLLEDCGQIIDKKKKMPTSVKKVITILDYMCKKDMIKVISGNYRVCDQEFILEIIESNYVSKDNFISLNASYFDFVINSKSSIKKGTLLHILLYCLSPYVKGRKVDKETGEIIENWYQVFSEPVSKISKNLGISKNTVSMALNVLSDSDEHSSKPLIMREHSDYMLGIGKNCSCPRIYTTNEYGWEERIQVEWDYYDKKIAKSKNHN